MPAQFELLDLLQCVTRSGRKTSEFVLAFVYVVLVPVLDAIVRAVVDVIDARRAAGLVALSPTHYVALAALSAAVVASYALGRSYMKGQTAAAATRAIADIQVLGKTAPTSANGSADGAP